MRVCRHLVNLRRVLLCDILQLQVSCLSQTYFFGLLLGFVFAENLGIGVLLQSLLSRLSR